jgi:hypothetical protein
MPPFFTKTPGEIVISDGKRVRISVGGIYSLNLDAGKKGRFFRIINAGNLLLDGPCQDDYLNFTGGKAFDGGVVKLTNGTFGATCVNFYRNEAVNGGAISSENSFASLSGCNLENSTADDAAGGVFGDKDSAISIQNSNFQYCSAQVGGAIFTDRGTNLTVTEDSHFRGCTSAAGGAIYSKFSLLELRNSTFEGNNVTNYVKTCRNTSWETCDSEQPRCASDADCISLGAYEVCI